jgi:hypothetical protein
MKSEIFGGIAMNKRPHNKNKYIRWLFALLAVCFLLSGGASWTTFAASETLEPDIIDAVDVDNIKVSNPDTGLENGEISNADSDSDIESENEIDDGDSEKELDKDEENEGDDSVSDMFDLQSGEDIEIIHSIPRTGLDHIPAIVGRMPPLPETIRFTLHTATPQASTTFDAPVVWLTPLDVSSPGTQYLTGEIAPSFWTNDNSDHRDTGGTQVRDRNSRVQPGRHLDRVATRWGYRSGSRGRAAVTGAYKRRGRAAATRN